MNESGALQLFWGARVANPWFAEVFGEHRAASLQIERPPAHRAKAARAGKAFRRHGMASRAPQNGRAALVNLIQTLRLE